MRGRITGVMTQFPDFGYVSRPRREAPRFSYRSCYVLGNGCAVQQASNGSTQDRHAQDMAPEDARRRRTASVHQRCVMTSAYVDP